jgi:hypothetical protein
MLLSLAISLVGLCQADLPLPRRMALEEPRQQDPTQERYPPLPPQQPAASKQSAFIDLDWLEVTPAVGFAWFSDKYLADPSAGLSLTVHAPMPWLSPPGDANGEYFGLFFEAAFMTLDRNLSPTVDHRSGLASFYTVGVDFSLLRDSTWILVARGGLLYAYYGGIADLKSGFGGMLGASAGIQLSGKMGLVYSPEFLFGKSGTLIVLNTLGLSIQF